MHIKKVNLIVKKGKDRIDKSFNILRIIKNVRDLKHVAVYHSYPPKEGDAK